MRLPACMSFRGKVTVSTEGQSMDLLCTHLALAGTGFFIISVDGKKGSYLWQEQQISHGSAMCPDQDRSVLKQRHLLLKREAIHLHGLHHAACPLVPDSADQPRQVKDVPAGCVGPVHNGDHHRLYGHLRTKGSHKGPTGAATYTHPSGIPICVPGTNVRWLLSSVPKSSACHQPQGDF